MIFRILDLLSNSHAAVVNGRAFEFEPTSKTPVFTLVVLFCAAYTLLTSGPNQVETTVQSLHF